VRRLVVIRRGCIVIPQNCWPKTKLGADSVEVIAMDKSGLKLSSDNVLCYRDGNRRPAETVRRHYYRWRKEQSPPLPERCDNKKCRFHTEPLLWNCEPLKPILDHKNGVNTDNRPTNLQLLCPNCDSQNHETRGGANKGRTEKSSGGFAKVDRNGKRDYVMPAETGRYKISTGSEDAQPSIPADAKKRRR
jgi:hypothetical protein